MNVEKTGAELQSVQCFNEFIITIKWIKHHHSECVLEELLIYFCPESYLAHTPLSLLLSLRHAVQVLSLVGWHRALLLLHAHVAAVGQSHAGHHGPSAHHGGWWDGSAHPWSETLWIELHLGLTHVHTC